MTVSISFDFNPGIATPLTLCGEMRITVDGRDITKWENINGSRSKHGIGFRLVVEYMGIVGELTEVCRAFPLDQEATIHYGFGESGETLDLFVEPDGETTIVVRLDYLDSADDKRATTTFTEVTDVFVQAHEPLREGALERGVWPDHPGLSRLEDTTNELEACLQEKSEVA